MTKTYRWARRAVWGTLAVVMSIGCNPLATFAFITHKDTPVPARYPLFPKEEGKKEKEEVTVAVFVFQGTGQSLEFAGADYVIASELSKKMPEMAKENKKKVVVIKSSELNAFKMKNPNWKMMHAVARGKALNADFILDIHLNKMSLYQPGSLKQLYEGRAEIDVELYNVTAEGGNEPERYTHPFMYPKTGVLDATTIPVGTFQKEFLERLAIEIAQKHIDYKADSGIAEGR